VLAMTTTDITIYIKNTITKQQYEQALSAKLEAENQVRILKQQKKASAFQNLLLWLNQKQLTSRLM
jgi:membrane fusion protein (multidrug efflux system)